MLMLLCSSVVIKTLFRNISIGPWSMLSFGLVDKTPLMSL